MKNNLLFLFSAAHRWLTNNFEFVRKTFNSTSNYAKLVDLDVKVFGNTMFIRFVASTGDAMGMNMIGKVRICEKSKILFIAARLPVGL